MVYTIYKIKQINAKESKEMEFEFFGTTAEVKVSIIDSSKVRITLKYEFTSEEYVRVYNQSKGYLVAYLNGKKIVFAANNEVVSITKCYDTKEVKKTSTNKNEKKVVSEVKPVIVKPVEFKDGIVKHEKYSTIKTCLECNIPVYLAGPAGSGKNFTVEQIAKELGWNFYFSNSVQQEYKLTGFVDAGGKYHETEFYKACTDANDCVFFLDEMDASIPEVLVLLNAAIANGYFEFPNGRVNLEKVHFVAAGNTVGNGADETYSGRMVIDGATMDRFAIIEFDYDRNVELSLAKGNEQLVQFIEDLRRKANKKGVKATFSYRAISMIVKLEKAGMPTKEILKITVFKGMDIDTIRILSEGVILNNKYWGEAKKVA